MDCVCELVRALRPSFNASVYNALRASFLGPTLRYLSSGAVTSPSRLFALEVPERYALMLECFVTGDGGVSAVHRRPTS